MSAVVLYLADVWPSVEFMSGWLGALVCFWLTVKGMNLADARFTR